MVHNHKPLIRPYLFGGVTLDSHDYGIFHPGLKKPENQIQRLDGQHVTDFAKQPLHRNE